MAFRIAAAALWVLALGLWGCPRGRALPTVEEAVRVGAVRLHFSPGDQGELELDLLVRSPALQSGALTGIQWELWLGSRWFAAGTQALAEPAPARAEHSFTVRLPLAYRSVTPPGGDPSSVEVGVRGGLTLKAPAGTRRLPFEHLKRMTVRHLPVVEDEADGR